MLLASLSVVLTAISVKHVLPAIRPALVLSAASRTRQPLANAPGDAVPGSGAAIAPAAMLFASEPAMAAAPVVDAAPRTPGFGAAIVPAAMLALFASEPAMAAAPMIASAVPSALAAYGHYLALLLSTGSLVTERLLIKDGMSEAEFDTVAIADIVYGGAGALLVYTGYLRVTEYGKGWEFYQHEPIFWVKLTLLAIMGAASFFPTTKIIQLSVSKRDPATPYAPMSPRLVKRMTTLINAELLALASIPLSASLMARGVLYSDSFPWQAGAAPVALALGGLGFKYIKEALDWKEDPVV